MPSRLLKQVARAALPRDARNIIRTPLLTMRWAFDCLLPGVSLEIRPDWALQCPRAVARYFRNTVLSDPSQSIELDDFIQLCPENGVVFDVGCHFGLYSIGAAHFSGANVHVVAIDPSQSACATARKLAELNKAPQVSVIEAAVGARPGTQWMVQTPIAHGSYMVNPEGQAARDLISVGVTTIDELSLRYDEPDLIKIDVEGAELDVLDGASKTFDGARVPICLELHNQMLKKSGTDPRTVLERLRSYGYTRFRSGSRKLSDDEIVTGELQRFVAFSSAASPLVSRRKP